MPGLGVREEEGQMTTKRILVLLAVLLLAALVGGCIYMLDDPTLYQPRSHETV